MVVSWFNILVIELLRKSINNFIFQRHFFQNIWFGFHLNMLLPLKLYELSSSSAALICQSAVNVCECKTWGASIDDSSRRTLLWLLLCERGKQSQWNCHLLGKGSALVGECRMLYDEKMWEWLWICCKYCWDEKGATRWTAMRWKFYGVLKIGASGSRFVIAIKSNIEGKSHSSAS